MREFVGILNLSRLLNAARGEGSTAAVRRGARAAGRRGCELSHHTSPDPDGARTQGPAPRQGRARPLLPRSARLLTAHRRIRSSRAPETGGAGGCTAEHGTLAPAGSSARFADSDSAAQPSGLPVPVAPGSHMLSQSLFHCFDPGQVTSLDPAVALTRL
jgi:hypothetical protein